MPDLDPLPPLPALKSLGRLSELRPTIIVDSREQLPLEFHRLPSQRGTLFTGDYGILGAEWGFTCERKSISDLVSCCVDSNRERFEHELHRAQGFPFRRLVVVGKRADLEAGLYRSQISPKAVMATVTSFEIRYAVPVVYFDTPEEAAREIERWAWYFARQIVESANTLCRGNGLTERKAAEPAATT